ncbi:unnamed protein product, partial [Polarella glacialis]
EQATAYSSPEQAAAAAERGAEGVAAAVASSVTMTFEQNGKPLDVTFTKRPLGFVYGPQAKPSCCATGSSGKWVVTNITAGNEQVKEVRLGAVILKINGVEVGTNKDKPEFDELIKSTVVVLPEA